MFLGRLWIACTRIQATPWKQADIIDANRVVCDVAGWQGWPNHAV